MEPNKIYFDLCGLFFLCFVSFTVWSHYSETLSPLALRYRTFGPRFWAGDVDSAVLWPVTTLICFLASREAPLPVSLFIWFISSFYYLAYSITLHAKYGQTVGKMACKVRVVDFKTEENISWRQALLRDSVPLFITIVICAQELFLLCSGKLRAADLNNTPDPHQALGTYYQFIFLTLFLWFCAELVTMLTNKKRRAIHDFIAGTVVVRTNIQPDEQPDNYGRPDWASRET